MSRELPADTLTPPSLRGNPMVGAAIPSETTSHTQTHWVAYGALTRADRYFGTVHVAICGASAVPEQQARVPSASICPQCARYADGAELAGGLP